MKMLINVLVVLFLMCQFVYANDAMQHLQDISLTIKSGRSEGSGVLITRDIKVGDKIEKVNFIWTAAHVIDDLRTVRSIITPSGESRKVVEFKDASIVKELNEGGRRVGELKMDAKVIKFSDSTNGEDLALLMVRKRDFVQVGATFFLKENPQDEIIDVGTELYHCGSLLGQLGANSVTRGIVSQNGRIHKGKVYDQTTVTAFPGSSGGGTFIIQENKPIYVGMVVRGSGETFNLTIPIRRIHKWARKVKVEWALDPNLPTPTLEEIEKMTIEENTITNIKYDNNKPIEPPTVNYIFLDGEHKNAFFRQHNSPATTLEK